MRDALIEKPFLMSQLLWHGVKILKQVQKSASEVRQFYLLPL